MIACPPDGSQPVSQSHVPSPCSVPRPLHPAYDSLRRPPSPPNAPNEQSLDAKPSSHAQLPSPDAPSEQTPWPAHGAANPPHAAQPCSQSA